MSESIKLIVGLGNPGAEYANTRHNVGVMTVELLAERLGVSLRSHSSRTRTASGRLGVLPGGAPGPQVHLAVSTSYMNVSGGPIGRLADFLRIAPTEILVVHDDLDLPAHQLRLKRGGGEGGHNGLKSLSAHLGTKDYARLRVGIGRPPGRQDPASFVLTPIPTSERPEWDVTIQLAADVAEETVLRGLVAAQQDLHARS
ncbi:aminoacyl-tRNA hydrolase [Scrofimicrobium sp. R131]|uniref:Peptidyl-tRNA hydrolase n=1 Tax=Scrofimicrobium appendicitidis TaxID=3079930 RepID=A0AAU7VAE5_9ACTO